MRSVLQPLALAIACLATTPLMAALPAKPAAHAAKPVKVLASLPITYGLAEVLLKGTDVQLERAAPANLPRLTPGVVLHRAWRAGIERAGPGCRRRHRPALAVGG